MTCELHRCTHYQICNREQIKRGDLVVCYVNSDLGSRDEDCTETDLKQNEREAQEIL